MKLTNKQKQYLKGLAHALKPVVLVGGNGLTENVLTEIDNALSHHELIKVKVPSEDREEKKALMDAIVQQSGAEKLQVIGHMLVIYRQSDEPKIELPKK
ncbi:ribosome assembly RNA-binding protein YhbY [Paraneptunicella aestuarii]|uniref:ribosome assembly RNA-binding protein YhbY n=1 Tax=Paraneptunicella aestuarii TaxID=2831148 RepID=UPI001E50756C|nr:ribosome assembly RNA-binding protein YhbY [Paraneptunicella aestuarii]UAA39891.1 ribosome assembly RNA-binding protein YhbY [Paraneptunicella aestuarii]